MENPGFQDSDQSMYETTLGICRPAAMPRPRRPHHLATFHHPHPHNAVITHTHSPALHGLPVTTHSNTIPHSHFVSNSHGIPATAHLHGGRVVGVTGVPNSAHSTPAGTPQGLPAQAPQPLYSCQAPRGHDHVYQCPGHRGDPIDHHHNNAPDLRDAHVEHQLDLREVHHLHQLDDRLEAQHYLDQRDHPVVEVRDRSGAGPDQRTEYHYGGSDYSSTEPIYAQPHIHPHDGQSSSPARTPPLTYTAMRGSLRASSSSSSTHHHGTPARFLVRTDSTGASTSSSTLPTVSALMAMDPAHSRSRTHTHEFSKVATLSSTPSTPAKLKRSGVLGAWRAKYLEGTGGSRKAALLLGLLVLLLILVLGGLAAVLYLTLGGGFGAIVGQPPQLVHLTEKGSSIVTGQFRITNQNYWHGLADVKSESFKVLAESIEKEMDSLFLNSVWSREFNRSEVVSLSDGSLVVRARFHLNIPDTSAAKKLGSVFLRGLHKRHNQEWLGPYTIDITSIRFAEILVDSTVPLSSSPAPLSHSTLTTTTYTKVVPKGDTSKKPTHRPNVGWGQWGPWSSCSPCSPQYDQIRTRECRLDEGKGILVSNIELCLPEGHVGHLQGARGNMESRPCQCHETELEEVDEEEEYVDEAEEELESTTESSASEASSSSKLRGKSGARETEFSKFDEDIHESGICDTCGPGQVCVGLVGDSYATCRLAKNPSDPTGCGGLCMQDIEVCQALGSRAFQCHSASQCLDDEWRCADGLCIPQAKRCDGHLNCYDRSDENMCKCSSDEFHCGNQTSCLPLSAKCDGNVDCWDGLDEANCSSACSSSSSSNPLDPLFPCRSGHCIEEGRFCDGFPDCRDGSDEPFGCSGQCRYFEFQCKNGRCVAVAAVCDERDTCGDLSDEQDCNRSLVAVSSGERTLVVNHLQQLPSTKLSSSEPALHTPPPSTSTLQPTSSTRQWVLHLFQEAVTKSSKRESSTPEPLLELQRLLLPSIERGWRRTAQIMPRLEDYAKRN